MGSAVRYTVLAATMFVPVLAISQTPGMPLTRLRVHNQLIQFEDAGYYPSRKDNRYTALIQAAAATISSELTESLAQQAAISSVPQVHSPSYALLEGNAAITSSRSTETEPACVFCW
ncbi:MULTISPECIES: DUF4148 domain-containing protein [Burkholderia cepacia complex]|uniref:DUF4148 domain-containing protein n=1 Tax=Burkholderia cepacia complex TaxID=87882 RepID=UPI000B0CA44E|nr:MULTISPECIES: DUF4148 domain-containing protein [Burkholderia cepacia complex]VWC14227.1 purine nucleoside phosphorylase [Burkholderia metallica]